MMALIVAAGAAPVLAAPPGGTSRNISVTGTSPIFNGDVTVSAGEQVAFTVTVANGGPQNVNNVGLLFGRDDNPAPQANGDATLPVVFPDGISVTTTTAGCTGGQTLTCTIGSLAARKSFTVDAVLVSEGSDTTFSGPMLVEAVVSISEAGGDSGYNIDTFSTQGDITVVPFSCDSTTAYRPGSSNKEVSTCSLGDARNQNGQASKIKLPSNLSIVTLSETDASWPAVLAGGCFGKQVDADVTGDGTGDVLVWGIQIDLTGLTAPNPQKLSVYHTNDEGVEVTISLAKSNSCKKAASVDCGSASIVGNVLFVAFQTAGNGGSRVGLR